MALQTTTDLYIGATQIETFKSVLLHQQIGTHHTMQIVCRMDALEDMSSSLGEQSKNFLGETITLQTKSLDEIGGYKELDFEGVVTQIKTIKGHEASNGDEIVITAQSPSFLADDGVNYRSYNEASLSDIIGKTFEGYDTSKLSVDIRPQNDITLDYSVQHHESSYAYARRLAAQYGEWFYYDGMKLVFGQPDNEEITLTYGFDLKEYQLSLMPQSQKYKIFANDYLTDQVQEKSTADVAVSLNGFNGFVADKSDQIFTKETQLLHATFNDSKVQSRLDKQVENQRKAIAVNQVKISGTSENPGVKLGSIVNVEGVTYRIVKISHTNNDIGDYENHFEGVTSEDNIYPLTDINRYPKSDPQTAIVKENADPEGLGRVKVQFHWQKQESEMTPWIRIVTPHAGGDKGFHFIPEVGEEVLIGFEEGNAEHPYVMGSLYNGTGKAEEFKTDANDVKVIRTRSGHTIELNDTEGEEKINIYDNEGSIITFDTQAKSLHITATENIEMQAKNIKITAEENIELQAQKEIKTASEGDTSIISQGATNLQADSDTSISSSANVNIEATSNAELKGQAVKVEGQTTADLKGQQTSVQGQMTSVQGASGKIEVV